MAWTRQQQRVIEERGHDLLVSAAAGSGKTAVLVERIIGLVTDEQNPVDIDRLLVVTFTRAAASEMRERVTRAIAEKYQNTLALLKKEKTDDAERARLEHLCDLLERQQALIHNAQITTIDSFCLFVVRNHFQDIALDPGFRIADEGELKLLEQEVMDQVFEEWYAKSDNAGFLALVDRYSGKRGDGNIRDMVSRLYGRSESSPWPDRWLQGLSGFYDRDRMAEEDSGVGKLLAKIASEVLVRLKEAEEQLGLLQERAKETEGLEKYVSTIEKDRALFEQMPEEADYKQLRDFLCGFKMGNMAAIRGFSGDEARKEEIKERRGQIKKQIEGWKEKYFSGDAEEIRDQLAAQKPLIDLLIAVTLDYRKAMAGAKRQRKIVDFSDIEHFALNIFVDGETGELRPAAEEFEEHFQEIMIDEYQDSNQVQETILKAISGGQKGRHKRFMVGDVKQSIYRFRLACPELFMEKYESYGTTEQSPELKIILDRNFRSREEVLSFTNDVFYKIMQKDLGDIGYDDEAELKVGAVYPEAEGMEGEILLVDPQMDGDDEENDDPGQEESARRLEARLIGQRIRKMMEDGFRVADVGEEGDRILRPVRYADMVILLRSLRGWAEEFSQVISDMGIPVQVESSTGYFAATEVQVVLSFLQILDNPLQDIPMAAVLKSPIGGFTEEEMAEIALCGRGKSFSEKVCALMGVGDEEILEKKEEGEIPDGAPEETPQLEDEDLERRLQKFGAAYRRLRGMVRDTPVHRLIRQILKDSGYGNYAAAMTGGERRSANLDMLVQKAVAYEKTSYKGLFHFVRYIEKLRKYEVDYGEADAPGEGFEAVRIMTIHKSKGLEFPVVFVSGCAKNFNEMDTRQKMVLHPDLGIGLLEVNGRPRRWRKTFFHRAIADQISRENLCEEMRILYVAMTRAKEKLILTGVAADFANVISRYTGQVKENTAISYTQREGAKKYLDWIFPAILSYPGKYHCKVYGPRELAAGEMKKMAEDRISRWQLIERIKGAEDVSGKLEQSFSYTYPYEEQIDRKSKYSVSELKKASMLEQYDRSQELAVLQGEKPEGKDPVIPDFIRDAAQGSDAASGHAAGGAMVGTAVHRIMECLDFVRLAQLPENDRLQNKNFVRQQMERMHRQGEITEEMYSVVSSSMIEAFVCNPIARRMAAAAAQGNLYKEKPFVMEYGGVLVQGIIDVFWLEGDRIVVLDYKTDRVKEEKELIMRYQKQLELYGEALERYFGREKGGEKTERLLYAFHLKEVVRL